MHSANLIALQAYPGTEGNAESHTDPAEHSDFLWRQRFLRSDPEGTLSRAAAAAERALGTNLDRGIRRRGLLLLANARSALGDHAGEVAALADAVRREPHEAMLWMLLARAYREAGRFARAEAALRRADTCLERGSTKP
jgi:predicted Zn-dependent protease